MTSEGRDGPVDMEGLAALPPEERARVWKEAHGRSWSRRFPVNLRLSLPLFSQRYFVTVVAGRERRSGERLARERRMHPLLTGGNLFFLLVVILLSAIAAFFIIAGLRALAAG